MAESYFTDREFHCKCGKCPGGVMSPIFVEKLNKMRSIYGKPIVINSAFRCADHNKKVGGKPSSYHLQGRAADIRCSSDAERYQLLRIAISIFGGIGIENGFLHVDDRPTTQVCWTY